MRLITEVKVAKQQLESLKMDKDEYDKFIKREMLTKIVQEMMDTVDIQTEDRGPSDDHVRHTAEIMYMPKSQWEHVLGMMRTLHGIDKNIDDGLKAVVYEIGR